MRAMWRVHGKPGGAREGYVDRPYTAADAEARLAEVERRRAPSPRDFFSRYIHGREAADYSGAAGAGGVRRPPAQPRTAPGGATSESEPRNGRMSIAALVAGEFAGLRRRPRAGR